MPSKSKVCFFFERKDFSLRNRTRLKKFIEKVFKREGVRLESLNYIFCSDKRLLEINRDFLKHDYYTDIITFDLSDSANLKAEIYISSDRVKENARNQSVSFSEELLRVIFHGVLHLCGYSDKSASETRQIRAKEDQYISLYRAKGSTGNN